ncbi:hypothetical protein SSBR45G_46920 [Bradyrhizobium sp. SSBR45G]|uniref:Tc toxin subunit A-related protein n=1 Tax=unclassified Bradyrhizobium TaxID=2631580 RepID=UPI002342959F|nr:MULTISPECIES: neuraminidase-like domain-containing protein [unclassified Bradyrhizobium]GLH79783.1 hypothetical protein SSBR45G_46920 [Bradyrhizobium sp. SSBR45G]GLH87098.1 hypothetical protein SSBR45R_45580 [Bradyrhizobium sp. SSBR45R]
MSQAPSALVAAYLTTNPGFDPLHDHVLPSDTVRAATQIRTAAAGPAAAPRLAPAAAPETLKALQGYQRALRLVSEPQDAAAQANAGGLHPVAATLLDSGFDAAHKVAALPEHVFVAEQGPALPGGAAQARGIYARAQHVKTQAAHVFALVRDRIASPFSRSNLFKTSTPQTAAAFQQVPGYDELFGSLDYCPCGHSDSIIGPGAYYVDLMRITDAYITGPNAASIPSGQRLEDRRPDLFDLPVTAANADTEIPFLTVVTEVLERNLAATPDQAYRLLATSGFPFNLPFTLPSARIRLNLDQLGTSLGAVGHALRPTTWSAPYPLPPLYLGGEILGLGASECDFTTFPSPLPQWLLEQCYGIDGHHDGVLTDLASVKMFLQRTGLERGSLDALLSQDLDDDEIAAGLAAGLYINNTGEGAPLALARVAGSSEETLKGLTNKRLERLSSLIRMSRALGWTFAELDWVVRCCGGANGVIDAPLIQTIAQMKQVGLALGETSPIAMTALFSDLKTTGRGSGPAPADFFDARFNNPSILAGRDPYASGSTVPFNPASPVTWTIANRSGTDGEIRSRLCGALQVTDDDLSSIAGWVCALSKKTDLTTDLSTLSLLYQVARLPRLLGLQVPQFLTLLGLMYSPSTDPMLPAAASVTFDLNTLGAIADAAAWLKAQPFTIYELQWSLTNRTGPYFRAPDPTSGLGAYVDSLATQSQTTRVQPASLALGTVTPDQATAAFNALVTAKVLSSIGLIVKHAPGFTDVSPGLPLGAAALTTPDITAADAATALALLTSNHVLVAVTAADGTALGYLAAPVTAKTSLDFLFQDSPTAPRQRRAVLQILLQATANVSAVVDLLTSSEAQQVNAAVEGLATRLQLAPEMVGALLPFASAELTVGALMLLLLTPLNGADAPADLQAVVLALARVGLIASRLNLTPAEATAIASHPSGFSVGIPQALTIADVRALSVYKDLTTQYQDSALVLANCVFSSNGVCQQSGIDALAAITAWPSDQIEVLAGTLWSGSVKWTVDAVATLRRCFELTAQLSGDAWFLLRLNAAIGAKVMTIPGSAPGDRQIGILDSAVWDVLSALAAATLDAVNGRFRDDTFAQVSGRIQGRLLTAQRDALLGAVIWKLNGTPVSLGIETPSDLYQYLLLDVEMSGCMMTSRIIQATAAVQLYMQRCRMGLEDGVTQFPFDPIWWSWMSSYRIWEVNRKIFLYPENYVDPTLRVKITPPFSTLKQRLQQSDLTDTAVEDAYREYFNSVETLGTLRLIDGYNVGSIDPGTNSRIFTLWLFARTGTEPYTYYFRTFDNATWSPWQKIDHSVPAALATPVWAFNTPYLFWIEPSTTQASNIDNAKSQALTSHKSTMKFIRRRPDASWSAPQALVSDSVVGYQVDYTFDSYAATVTPGLNQSNFELAQSAWRKPIVLFAPASATIDPQLPQVDRLMTTLGFSLDFIGGTAYPAVAAPTAVVPDQLAYDSAIYGVASRLKNITGAVPSMVTGRVQYGTLQIVDAMANHTVRHLTLLNTLPGTSATPVTPAIDRSAGSFGFAATTNELAATFAFDDFAGQSPAMAPKPGTVLLNSVNAQLANTVNVKNQLGWFLLDNADEAFLVQADQVSFPTLSEILTVSEHQSPLPMGESYLRVAPITSGGDLTKAQYRFARLTTQTIPMLAQRLAATGLPGLLNIDAQSTPELPFSRLGPTASAIAPASATLDFNGAMGDYFREIFFHAPFLVAYALNASRRFDQAQHWFEYIFNPTAPQQSGLNNPTDRFWNYLPFRDLASSDLAKDLTDPAQIAAYNNSPFDPDAIAGLRPAAYAKATVMRYISNILDWGDQLFRAFTRESVNEATNLYVMASDLLGPKPREVSGRAKPAPMSFRQIKAASPGGLVPEFLINVENLLAPVAPGTPLLRGMPFNDINSYFCIPENDEFVAYWDRVAGQLYKIRHCMNINGEYQTLPLLAPPLDVRAVIAAAAAGGGGLPLDFGTAVPIPAYRFEALLARARAIAGDVAQLGAQVQSSLERQDAEQLELLRNVQEKNLLDLTTDIRTLHIQQLESTRSGLQTSLASADYRYSFYDNLLQKGLSDAEKLNLAMLIVSQVLSTVGGTLKTMASAGFLVPNAGSPFAMTYGGKQVGSSLTSIAEFFNTMAGQASFVGNVAQLSAGYERRAADWTQQRTIADYDRKQIQQQIDAAGYEIDSAKQELQLHLKTLAQNGEMAAYLKSKFTSSELYQWLIGRLSAMHYQTYTLAYDLARMTERALQYELNGDQTYLQFGYWDNVHKGLTSGEGLQLALNRMERAWLDGNTRTLEIRRTVALSQLDPLALVRFRTTGSCEFALTEKLFDYDYPGHYCRKIKTITVSIPAVVGPWQTINATLTQLSSQIVVKPDSQAIDFLLGDDVPAPDASVLRTNWCAQQQIALSSGISDSGLFQLDFRDDRYLPFEGTGAVSRWRLDMPPAANRIDFGSIADVVVDVSYTALDGGAALRAKVTALPALQPFTGQVLMPIADLQPDAWSSFLADHGNTTTQTLTFTVLPRAVPPHVSNAVLTNVSAILQSTGPATPPATSFINYKITPQLSTDDVTVSGKTGLIFDANWLGSTPGAQDNNWLSVLPIAQLPAMSDVAGQHAAVFTLANVPAGLKTAGFIDPQKLKNLILVLEYQGQVRW